MTAIGSISGICSTVPIDPNEHVTQLGFRWSTNLATNRITRVSVTTSTGLTVIRGFTPAVYKE